MGTHPQILLRRITTERAMDDHSWPLLRKLRRPPVGSNHHQNRQVRPRNRRRPGVQNHHRRPLLYRGPPLLQQDQLRQRPRSGPTEGPRSFLGLRSAAVSRGSVSGGLSDWQPADGDRGGLGEAEGVRAVTAVSAGDSAADCRSEEVHSVHEFHGECG